MPPAQWGAKGERVWVVIWMQDGEPCAKAFATLGLKDPDNVRTAKGFAKSLEKQGIEVRTERQTLT